MLQNEEEWSVAGLDVKDLWRLVHNTDEETSEVRSLFITR